MKGTLATEADLMKERREIRIKFSFNSWNGRIFADLPNLRKAQVTRGPRLVHPDTLPVKGGRCRAVTTPPAPSGPK